MNILQKLQRLFIKNDIDNSVNKDECIDEYGVMYSADKKKLIKGTYGLNEYRIIEGCEIIGNFAFRLSEGLTNIVIPNSVISIEKGAFYLCTCLTSIVIPNSVTSIEDRTFVRCRTLEKVTIGNSVASIGELAFSHTIIKEVHSISQTPPQIGKNCFGDPYQFRMNNCKLYVPKGSKEAYKKAWGFENIIEE